MPPQQARASRHGAAPRLRTIRNEPGTARQETREPAAPGRYQEDTMSKEAPAPPDGRRMLAGSLSVHPVGIGCWAIGGPDDNLGMPMGWSTASDEEALRGLEAACALGANLFDTADVYG